jgi:hypothetical protein
MVRKYAYGDQIEIVRIANVKSVAVILQKIDI